MTRAPTDHRGHIRGPYPLLQWFSYKLHTAPSSKRLSFFCRRLFSYSVSFTPLLACLGISVGPPSCSVLLNNQRYNDIQLLLHNNQSSVLSSWRFPGHTQSFFVPFSHMTLSLPLVILQPPPTGLAGPWGTAI